jgi:hypothetical protein
MEIRFTPSRVGLHQAEVLIITQADTLRQSIIGEGILPDLEIVEGLIDFGQVRIANQKDTIQAITITNTRSTPLTIFNTSHGAPNIIDFSTLAGGGNFILAPGDTAKLDLRFEPSAVGRTSGKLLFEHDGNGSPAAVQLFGEGVDTTALILQIDDDEALTGDVIEIPIFLVNTPTMLFTTEAQVRTEVMFNPSLLFPLDFPVDYLTPTTAAITVENLNLIPENSEQGDTLIFIRFKVGTGNAERCNLQLVNTQFVNDDNITIQTIDGVFTLLGICEEGGMRLINPENAPGSMEIAPNPTNGRITVTFNAIEEGFMELVMFNLLGERIQTLFAGDITDNFGRRTMEADISGLGAGKYILKLTTPTYSESLVVIVIQ